jgi:hypothetical protein
VRQAPVPQQLDLGPDGLEQVVVDPLRVDAVQRLAVDALVHQHERSRLGGGQRDEPGGAHAEVAGGQRHQRLVLDGPAQRPEALLVAEVARHDPAVEAEQQVGAALVHPQRLDEQAAAVAGVGEVRSGAAGVQAGLVDAGDGHAHVRQAVGDGRGPGPPGWRPQDDHGQGPAQPARQQGAQRRQVDRRDQQPAEHHPEHHHPRPAPPGPAHPGRRRGGDTGGDGHEELGGGRVVDEEVEGIGPLGQRGRARRVRQPDQRGDHQPQRPAHRRRPDRPPAPMGEAHQGPAHEGDQARQPRDGDDQRDQPGRDGVDAPQQVMGVVDHGVPGQPLHQQHDRQAGGGHAKAQDVRRGPLGHHRRGLVHFDGSGRSDGPDDVSHPPTMTTASRRRITPAG